METKSGSTPGSQDTGILPGSEQEENKSAAELSNQRPQGIKSIHLTNEHLVITAELSGVFCQGIQYYDLRNIHFINNAGMASLIDLLKSLLRQGIDVQFVNVHEKIKRKIRAMDLDHILKCS